MQRNDENIFHDFKGIGYSKIGYFKEVRSKIKELERLNIELLQRHNKLEAIFNSMSDGLTILDRDLNILFANHVQKSMFPDVSMIGKKCHRIFFRRRQPCKNCPALRTMETRETILGESLIREGEYAGRFLEWTTTPIVSPSGQVEEIIYLMRDITVRKEYEFKIMQADRMAAIGFLAAGVAHEINNPLTSVAGFSEGLLKRINRIKETVDDKTLDTFRDYLEIINNEAYRCKEIIQNLVNFSRKSSDDCETIPIDRLINETISIIRQHAKDNNIKTEFKNNLAAGLNQILANESQIKHVFLSLFNRAFKNFKEGGALTITARNNAQHIEVLISKAGTKYSPEDLQRNPMFPKNRISEPPDEKGASMNLSVCYNIVNRHKGELHFIEDKVDGFVCHLRFPITLP